MDDGLPSSALDFIRVQAGVGMPALTEKVGLKVREHGPYQSRKCIDDAAELVLHPDPLVTVAVA